MGEVFQDGEGIVEGLSAVDDDGQVEVGGDLEVEAEDSFLVGLFGKVVVEVEACFADCDDLVALGEMFQFSHHFIGDGPGVVGVDGNGGVKVAMVLCEFHCFSGIIECCAHGNPRCDGGIMASLKDLLNLSIECVKCQVTVRVD